MPKAEKHPEDPEAPRQLLEDLSRDVDLILDEIDEVLEENAEEFVRSYVQKGGNGGGEVLTFIQAWMQAIGPQRAADVLELLTRLYEEDWPYKLLMLRYGSRTARYWIEVGDSLRLQIASVAATQLEAADPELRNTEDPNLTVARRERLINELNLRAAERRGDFVQAKESLIRVAAADAKGAAMLLEEYKHLKAADVSDLRDSESEPFQLQQVHCMIKSALAPITDEPQYQTRPISKLTVELLDTDSPDAERPKASVAGQPTHTIRPQLKGAALEEATVALLRRLFHLSADDANAVSTRIRRQGSGYQFGHDISFTAPAVTNDMVQCHVECKNYRRQIRPADIADKLLQQRMAARGAPIDHWILISPHTDPSNDLAEMLNEWEAEPYWDFRVHVWSPASHIQDFFALDPQVYRAVYNGTPPSVDASSVVAEFRRRITPRLRMHRGLEAYLREPWRMCFATEDAGHFTDLLVDHVDLGTIDIAGRSIGKPLQKVVDSWLQAETPSTMLLLGEFGDGKSFFTYMLCRELAHQFLNRSSDSRFPVRLTLRDLRKAGSAEKAIEDWLHNLGVPMTDWRQLAAAHPTLIVLDGFDEMTAELDPPTISQNLRLLAEALDSIAGTFTAKNKKRKVLVTSRGRFFDQPREETALREMLGFPSIVRIRPLSRTEVLAHLSRYAREINAEERLAKIQILYDPIGL
jgi:ubiquitin-like protein Pup